MRRGKRWDERNGQGGEERARLGLHENRRRGDGFAMAGSEKRDHAKMGGGRVRMESFMQRR